VTTPAWEKVELSQLERTARDVLWLAVVGYVAVRFLRGVLPADAQT
jgi:hypothetical protein